MKDYVLTDENNNLYFSDVPGTLGGQRKRKIYGKLDCPSALKAFAKGRYDYYITFFLNERVAVKAGYRPCAICLPEKYYEWKINKQENKVKKIELINGIYRIAQNSPKKSFSTMPSENITETKNTNDFSGLIELIKKSTIEEQEKVISVKEFTGELFYGINITCSDDNPVALENPVKLKEVNCASLCQDLYNVLINAFGDNLETGWIYDMDGNRLYMMRLGKLSILFPGDCEYNNWVFDRIEKDNEDKQRKR